MTWMKIGKAGGPDDIPVEVWRCQRERRVDFLIRLFNILEGESCLRNGEDVFSRTRGIYRGIKLMIHSMNIWERVTEAKKLRTEMVINEQQ